MRAQVQVERVMQEACIERSDMPAAHATAIAAPPVEAAREETREDLIVSSDTDGSDSEELTTTIGFGMHTLMHDSRTRTCVWHTLASLGRARLPSARARARTRIACVASHMCTAHTQDAAEWRVRVAW